MFIDSFKPKYRGGVHGSASGEVVNIGDKRGEIIMKCGQPDCTDTLEWYMPTEPVPGVPKGMKAPAREIMTYYEGMNVNFHLEKAKCVKIETFEYKPK